MTSDPDMLTARFPTDRAERAIELATLFRRVREAQLDFLRRHAAEEVAEKVVSRRGASVQLSDPNHPHDLNRPIKHQRLSFDP